MQIIPGPTATEIADEIALKTGWEILKAEFKTYPDGESSIRFPKKPNEEVLIIQSLFQPQDTHIFQLLNMISTVQRLNATKMVVFTPYLSYARSDRDVLGGEAISAKTLLDLIEKSQVTHLICLDVHNPEIFDFVPSMKTSNLLPLIGIEKFLDVQDVDLKDTMIVAPDQGAIMRARKLSEHLKVPSTSLLKQRDPNTGKINLEIGENKEFKNTVILIDDIMSTGNSLVEASNLLKLYDVKKIHIIISHAIGTNAVDRLKEIGGGFVVSTNSIPSAISHLSFVDDLVEVLNG